MSPKFNLILGSFFDHGFKAVSAPSDCSWVLWEKKKGNDFVTVGKFFEYKFSKMLPDVWFDLSLLWQLPN